MRPFIIETKKAGGLAEMETVGQEKIDQDEAINNAIMLTKSATMLDK